jgi:cysteine desulfurase
MGVAAESVVRSLSSDIERMKELRDRLESLVIDAIPGTAVNGDTASRLCNTSNIYFPGRNAANLVEQLSARGVYVSAGAACSTGGKPSHVLRAMGMSDERANASLRFSLSKSTTVQEIDLAVAAITIANSSSLTIYNVM